MRTADVMGVVNVTPDSFSDGGEWVEPDQAAAHARDMLSQGARVIDVGGESTRPGAVPVSVDDEIARVVPVIDRIRDDVRAAGARVSVDTRHEAVAVAAVGAGATILNDVSASLESVAGDLGVGWVAMHMQGEPGTMQVDPTYDDVVAEVLDALVDAHERGRAAGVEEIWIDPGIGFGKSFGHNWELLAALDRFVATGVPVLVGASRKRFLGAALRDSDGTTDDVGPDDRLEASLAVAAWAVTMGATMIRAHDVRPTVRTIERCAAVCPPFAEVQH